MTRFNRFVGTIYIAKDSVLSVPSNLKAFVHRGRYGWATPDTWSMDYTLAKQLDGVFREFVRSSESIIDYEQDNTAAVAIEIADGFRYYWQHQERDWKCEFKADTIEKEIELERTDFDIAMARVKRSCELMSENWSRFWW